MKNIKAVPTNIVTGFLGVGKTSAILHLLKNKPAHERWAVLVNEFGEIGVDGSLFEGRHAQEQNIFIREVPGGCMCCTSGLPMQIALSQLLSRAKPDRLLIEPTGLGHPREVLQVLSAKHYEDTLLIQKTLTLVDARKLKDERYVQHDTFNQQISMADVVVGNKQDLYQAGDEETLVSYARELAGDNVAIVFAKHGEIESSLLEGATSSLIKTSHPHHHHKQKDVMLPSDAPFPESGFVKASNQGEGYFSEGWRFSPEKVFDYNRLFSFLSGITAERMKAVFITDKGVFGYNLTSDALTELSLEEAIESRIEIIFRQSEESLEAQLMSCLA